VDECKPLVHGDAFEELKTALGSALDDVKEFAGFGEPKTSAETAQFLERARRYAHGVANFGAVSAPLVVGTSVCC